MSKHRRMVLTVAAAATVIVAAAFFVAGRGRVVTEEMVGRVRVGMTQEEVEGVLGRPQEMRSGTATVAGKAHASSVCTWPMGDGRWVVVALEEGRVVRVERTE